MLVGNSLGDTRISLKKNSRHFSLLLRHGHAVSQIVETRHSNQAEPVCCGVILRCSLEYANEAVNVVDVAGAT